MNTPAYLEVKQQVGLADGLAVGFLFEGFAVGNLVCFGVGHLLDTVDGAEIGLLHLLTAMSGEEPAH